VLSRFLSSGGKRSAGRAMGVSMLTRFPLIHPDRRGSRRLNVSGIHGCAPGRPGLRG
jgi:hypothetical protein